MYGFTRGAARRAAPRRVSTRLGSSLSRPARFGLVRSRPVSFSSFSPHVIAGARRSALSIVVRVACARPSPAVGRRVRCAFLPSGWLRPRDVIHSSAYYAIQDTAVALFLAPLPPPSLPSRSLALRRTRSMPTTAPAPHQPPDATAARRDAERRGAARRALLLPLF